MTDEPKRFTFGVDFGRPRGDDNGLIIQAADGTVIASYKGTRGVLVAKINEFLASEGMDASRSANPTFENVVYGRKVIALFGCSPTQTRTAVGHYRFASPLGYYDVQAVSAEEARRRLRIAVGKPETRLTKG